MADGPACNPRKLRELEHDLRNAFTGMVSNVELLGRTVEEPAARRRLAHIWRDIERGVDVLDRMRDLSSES